MMKTDYPIRYSYLAVVSARVAQKTDSRGGWPLTLKGDHLGTKVEMSTVMVDSSLAEIIEGYTTSCKNKPVCLD